MDNKIKLVLDFLYFCESHDLRTPDYESLIYIMVEYFSLTYDEAKKYIDDHEVKKKQEEDRLFP